MASVLWRGSWATRLRIATGLVLFVYVTLHLLNIAAVLISAEFADAFQTVRLAVTRSGIGTTVVTFSLFAHLTLALAKLVRRRSFRMPFVDGLQIVMGLTIPLLLSSHVIYTQGAFMNLGVNTKIGYLTHLIWGSTDGWLQALLLIVTWVHGCIGLHMWLRVTDWWRNAFDWFIALAVLVPTLALAGYVSFAPQVRSQLADPDIRAKAYEAWRMPDADGFAALAATDRIVDNIIMAILAALALVLLAQRAFAAFRKPIRITYVDGPSVRAAKGQTLLQTSQASGVAHTALCGGRGRCTTCRVIFEEGLEDLPPPSKAEAQSLAAVNAPPNARLACQVRPDGPVTVFRVFRKDGKRGRAHASQGKEAQLAVLFLDMRGFTARTNGQLPYDVVFLLNRFFDQIVPPIVAAGGTIDKYLGDGLMAVFESDDPAQSARAALRAVEGIGQALQSFNEMLLEEGSATIAIGIGVHLGNVVLGEIGAVGLAPRTLIGDTVNTASRLEGQTKEQAVQALISLDVLNAAGYTATDFGLRSLRLRGLDEPLPALPVSDAAQLTNTLNQTEIA